MKKRSASKRFILSFVMIITILLVVFLITLCWGSYKVSVSDVLKVLMGQGERLQKTAVLSIRLPRMLVGMGVAMALSTSGCILQTITKNDLADPGIIGINAGGAVAAVLFIHMQTAAYYSELGEGSIYVLPFMAILGSMVAALVIYLLSCRRGLKPKRLLLVGIGVNAGLNAFISFFTFRGGIGEYNKILIWTSGSLWGAGWPYVRVLLPIVLIMFFFVLWSHKKMDAMTFSDEVSTGWGIAVEKERRKMLFCAVVLAGAATAFAGNVGFVGLIAPHMARRLVGPKHKYYMFVSAGIAMSILLLADAVSRNAFSPIEIPAGITVSIIGVPYFVYLMWNSKE